LEPTVTVCSPQAGTAGISTDNSNTSIFTDAPFDQGRQRRALGADEVGDVGFGRPFQQVGQRPPLDHPAFAHHDDVVAQVGGLAHVVGDQHDGLLDAAEDGFQLGLELAAGDGVQRAERLVEEDDLGVEHQGAH